MRLLLGCLTWNVRHIVQKMRPFSNNVPYHHHIITWICKENAALPKQMRYDNFRNALAKSLKDSPLGSFGIVEKLCNNASKSNDFLGIPWKISFCHKVIFWAKLQAQSGQRAT